MARLMIIYSCEECPHFQENMYHGACCWHSAVAKKTEEGHKPKKMKRVYNNAGKIEIPQWCPLMEWQ